MTGHRVFTARRPSSFLLIPVGYHRQGFAYFGRAFQLNRKLDGTQALFHWRGGPCLSLTLAPGHGPEQGAREVIPRYRVQCGRDHLVGFKDATPALGLEPLGFLNIIDCKFAQAMEFSILRSWINGRQQIPGACASPVTSHSRHERLLNRLHFLS